MISLLWSLIWTGALGLAWVLVFGMAASLWGRELTRPAIGLALAAGLGLLVAFTHAAWGGLTWIVLDEILDAAEGAWLTLDRWWVFDQVVRAALAMTSTAALVALVVSIFLERPENRPENRPET